MVVAGLVILLTGWLWVDPVASLIISGVIVWSTWGLLRDAAKLSLQGVPPQIDPGAVRVYLQSLPAVVEVHDLHIWPMSTTETALTCHLVMPDGYPAADFLDVVYVGLAATLRHRPSDHPDRARRPAVQAVAGAYCLKPCQRRSPRRSPARASLDLPSECYAGMMSTISNVCGSMIKS